MNKVVFNHCDSSSEYGSHFYGSVVFNFSCGRQDLYFALDKFSDDKEFTARFYYYSGELCEERGFSTIHDFLSYAMSM